MIAILITTILSCTVSKDIETPKDAFPENFRNASVSKDTSSIGDLEWKNFFTEKDIIQLIDSAVVRNNDLQCVRKFQLHHFKEIKTNAQQRGFASAGATNKSSS